VTADDRADDDDLDSQLDRLNREFYTADPSDYFETRWLSLLVMAGRADNVLAMLTEGVTYGHIHATIADAATTPEGVRNFATIESQVLLHHASEALLRLYLAHVVRPPCPWLELASERFETFKKNLRSKLLNPPASALHAGVAHVFLRGPVSETGMDEERWSKAVGNLTSYLRMFARRWLDDAHRYNSLKHGLAVSPSPRTMAFYADRSSEGHVLGYGASLAYLESDVAKRRQAWTMTIDWIDVSQSLALTSVAQGMIKSLWEIARARYTGAPPPRALYDRPTSLRTGLGHPTGRQASDSAGALESQPKTVSDGL
jgi:hypothetical protein